MVNRRQVFPQYDNAIAHTAKGIKGKLEELQGFDFLPQPTYNPEIALCDDDIFEPSLILYADGWSTMWITLQMAGLNQPNIISVELSFCHKDNIR